MGPSFGSSGKVPLGVGESVAITAAGCGQGTQVGGAKAARLSTWASGGPGATHRALRGASPQPLLLSLSCSSPVAQATVRAAWRMKECPGSVITWPAHAEWLNRPWPLQELEYCAAKRGRSHPWGNVSPPRGAWEILRCGSAGADRLYAHCVSQFEVMFVKRQTSLWWGRSEQGLPGEAGRALFGH